MNYDVKMKQARSLIDQGLYAQAMFTLSNALENLYDDFFQRFVAALNPADRGFITRAEEEFTRKGDKAARDKGFVGLTLGGKAKFFYEQKLVDWAEKVLKTEFPHFKTFDPRLFNAIRIDTVHGKDAVVTEEEANLFYSQLRVFLLETGFLKREVKAESVDLSGLGNWKQNGVVPNDDILAGNLQMDTYAADLWGVARNNPQTPSVYRDAGEFFKQTYLTESLERLLVDVLRVLGGGSGDRVLQLRTPFGGGKTHSLIALYHVAHSRKQLQHERMLADLPDPGECAVAAVQCEKFDVHKGHRIRDGLHIRTLWGEIAYQLAGEEGYVYFKASDEAQTAPGGQTISDFLHEMGMPVLILLDEVLNHVEAAHSVTIGNSNLGRQLMIFLKTLTEAVSASSNAALVYSLQASRSEALGLSNLLDDLDHLVSRIDAKRVPVSDTEVVCVVQRRLFKSAGDDNAARKVAAAYAESYRRLQQAASGLSPNEQHQVSQEAGQIADRILDSYPFHPDLLELMYHRWGSRPDYQRTRGALQFLASVVYDLWHHGRDLQPLIGPGDVLLEHENTRSAFFTQVGERENYNSVMDADITGHNARIKGVDARLASDSPNLQQYRIGTRIATAAMLYSFGAREGEERGVTENDLLKAVVLPGLDRMPLVTALSDLRQQLLYLHYTGRRYRFETLPNLNKLIHDATKEFSTPDTLGRVKTFLQDALRDTSYAVIWPENSGRINDRTPALQVAYLPLAWSNFSDEELENHLTEWLEFCGTTRRDYKNALAFAIPGYIAGQNAMKYALDLLAIEAVIERKRQYNFSAEQLQELNERRNNETGSLKASVSNLYERVAVPAPMDGNKPYEWRILQLTEQRDPRLHGQVLGALEKDYKLFDSVAPDKLLALTHLGIKNAWLPVEQVVAWFFQHFGFVRLHSAENLKTAISRGVRDGKLAYTAVFEVDDGEIYFPNPRLIYLNRDLKPGEIDLFRSVVLSPDLAQQMMYVPDEAPVSDEPERVPVSIPSPSPVTFPDTDSGQSEPSGEAGSGGNHVYRLTIAADKGSAFKAFRAIQNLVDKADAMQLHIQIEAEQDDGFDRVWLRNAVEEPLDEADIRFDGRFE